MNSSRCWKRDVRLSKFVLRNTVYVWALSNQCSPARDALEGGGGTPLCDISSGGNPREVPRMVTCELSPVVLFCQMSAQQAAHAVHEKGRKACQEPKNGPRRLSQKGL